jgi:tetratricopeptide repeat protein
MPHVLAADLAGTHSPGLRQLACDACLYLLARGDTHPAYDLARDLRQQWRDRLGDDHEHVLEMARNLVWALRTMGRYADARDLGRDTLDRRHRVLGEDHPDTLDSNENLLAHLRRAVRGHQVRDPRPRIELHRLLRRRLPGRRNQDLAHRRPGSAHERDLRAARRHPAP